MSLRRLAIAALSALAVVAAMLTVPQSAYADTNLALNRPVTVSSTDDPSNAAGNAVDGNTGTRWSSAYTDNQSITVDLGSALQVGAVTLRWEAAYGRGYQIQTSTDNASYTTRFTTSAGDGGTDTVTFTQAQARYVRVLGTARGTSYGYSLWELEVYPGGTAADTNIARNKPVAVSSNDGNPAANAVDGNTATRWSSNYTDNEWISVDLGGPAIINTVVLRWETAYGRGYRIQTSDNNSTWTDRFTTTTGDGGTDTIALNATQARYVRMLGTARATAWGYSLYEFEVIGTGGGDPGPGPGPGPDLTGFTLYRDYRFGTGAGRTVSNLSTDFNPYGIAGTTVINNEWQRYQTFNNTNHRLTGTELELTALANLGGVYNGGISSGQITTKETFYPRNGRTYVFQVRAKVPRGRGAWPAFWLYAKQAPNTPSEIDVFEFFDTPTQNTYDWTGYDHGSGVGANYHNIMTNQWVWHPGFDFADDYHVYTLVWKEGDIQKWVDGTWVKGTYFTWQGSDPQVLINLAIGGSTNNNPNAATFPSVFRVDYFRIWTRG
jgi:hypothetical protein